MRPTKITPEQLNENFFHLISKDWTLISAGTPDHYNTMTASWGGIGFIWNKPVATIFIRPQRYTYEFVENNDLFTLTFLPEQYRKALQFCGSKSGRDYDKAKECGLTVQTIDNTVTFEQARLVLVCKKLYVNDLQPGCFVDQTLAAAMYPDHDYHRMYVGEILGIYTIE